MLNRCSILVAVVLAIPHIAAAQSPDAPTTISLVLSPAAEPVPALKYRLLPDLREQSGGNAMQSYYRAYSPDSQGYRQEKNWRDPFSKALETPLNDLKASDLQWLTKAQFLREVDRGARKAHCDWELRDRVREEGFRLMLPDVQGMRDFARLLAVRARLELANGKIDEAAYSLRSGYSLARHTGQGPTFIHGLVGIASAQSMNKQIETWVQTPGTPNLYWSLTDLPSSLVDLRSGFQGERIALDSLLPDMRECLADPTRPAKSLAQLRNMLKAIEEITERPSTNMALPALAVAAKYPAAKELLKQHGWTAEQIDAVPAIQVVLIQEAFEYDRHFDNYAKVINLPYPQAHAFFQTTTKAFHASLDQPLAGPIVARALLPAIENVVKSKARLDRQVAALRVIEAIRMYAAANGNKLPASLDAIKIVPVPLDPATNSPFGYTLTGDKVMLTAELYPGASESPQNRLRYELKIGK